MKKYLLVDFGSTNTKLTAVDIETKEIIATAKALTTVETDINEGYLLAYNELISKLGPTTFCKKIACSSAAGGLKMAAIGLVEELTVEAAKCACFGAGAKVELVFSHYLTKSDLQAIKDKQIDIILLAGGTDGGNSEVVLYNTTMLGKAGITCAIIYAGNKSCQDEIAEIRDQYKLNLKIVSNIMPKLNSLNIDEAQTVIREIFLKNIIEAKGLKQIEANIDEIVYPTPKAVLKACELLACGYLDEPGLGDLVLVDIGGATTDIYSIASGAPSRADVILKGLNEPFAKRTVEGDLGMRYSSLGIVNSLSEEELKGYAKKGFNLAEDAFFRNHNIDFIPISEYDKEVDRLLAGICVDAAFSRHVGVMESVYTSLGMMYYQMGKDLSHVNYIIGTGGVIINDDKPDLILSKLKQSKFKALELRPINAKMLLDSSYILSAMGLLALDEPELALSLMKKYIKEI